MYRYNTIQIPIIDDGQILKNIHKNPKIQKG